MIDDKQLQEYLARLDPEQQMLFAEAALGEEARQFLDSNIGRYMVGCAQQEIVMGHRALKLVAPWRRRRITQIQNEIWRAEKFLEWLRDLLIQGAQAGQTLEQEEEDGNAG